MRTSRFVTACALLTGLAWGSMPVAQTLAQKTPMPPQTEQYSVQMFQGATQNCWIAVWPPNTSTDGTPIAYGTKVEIKVYRSYDGGKTYGERGVKIVGGGSGFVEQGERDSRTKRWIDCKLETPVDHKKPYAVWLAASAVIGGRESAKVNSNLTFLYVGRDGRPRLVRFPTPDITGVGMDDEFSRPLPQELPVKWTDGKFVITNTWVSPNAPQGGCDPAVVKAIDQKKGKPMAMEMSIKQIDLVGAPGLDGAPVRPDRVMKTHFPGTMTFKVTDPEATSQSKESKPMGFLYDYPNRFISARHTENNVVLRMGGHFFQNATHYSIHGTWKMTMQQDGKEAGWVRGRWSVYKRKP